MKSKLSVPNWVGGLLVGCGLALTVFQAGRLRGGASFLNTADTIFDSAHIKVEALILSAIVFLAADVFWRQRRDPHPGRWEARARRARLIIALAIFAVHATVLALGGYPP